MVGRIFLSALLAVSGSTAFAQSTPYGGNAAAMPARIEVEKYDLGGEGVAYHDSDATNSGGALRSDGVDLVTCTDTGCGQALTDVRSGEWLQYTVSNASTATYTLSARVASAASGASFHVEIDGVNATGPIAIPNTGSLSTWQTVTRENFVLGSGSHVLKLVADSNAFSVNWLELGNTQTPYAPGIRNIPGKIEAEHYDQGGNNIAWFDTSAGNAGATLRSDDVDIKPCIESAAGANCVTVNAAAEWQEYTVHVAQTATYVYTARVAGKASSSFHLEVDGAVLPNSTATINTGTGSAADKLFTTLNVGEVALNAGDHVVRLMIDTAGSGAAQIDWIDFASPQTPYSAAIAVPGTIELENYDVGGEGIAYHDTDTTNAGAVYRSDGVDLKNCTDSGCGGNKWVYNLTSAEWLEYTVNIAYAGNYAIGLRNTPQASGAGPSFGSMSVSVDGILVGTCDNTSSGTTPRVVNCFAATLSAGRHLLRVSVGAVAPTDVDYLAIQPVSTPKSCASCYTAVPGRIEAEDYDNGGQGNAYSDSDSTNTLGAYRTDGVDLATTSDGSGNYQVGSVAANEWLRYSVNANRAGPFDLKLRVASAAGGVGYLEVDGVNLSGNISIPNTGGLSTWQTLTVANLPMTAGQHVLRFFIVSGQFNLNWLQLDDSAASNAAPVVAISAPASNASFTAPASVALTANASDLGGSISKVEFYNGATLLNTDTTAPYGYGWTGVAAGTYSLTAKAYDNFNAATISSAVTITVTAANLAPTVSLSAPANNASYTAPAAISLAANAADSDGSIARVEFYNGATLLNSDTSAPYAFAWTGVGSGSYALTAKAYDNAGAVTASGVVTITVTAANVAPSVSITSPGSGALFPALSTVVINANATDSDGTIARVEFYNGTALLTTDSTAPYSYSWANVPSGSYTLSARAYDNSGAVSTSSAVAFSVGAPPTVSIDWPLDSPSFHDSAPVDFLLSASDPDGSIVRVELYVDGILVGSRTTPPYRMSYGGFDPGTYTVVARAIDNNGLSSDYMMFVTADGAAPAPTLDAPADGATVPLSGPGLIFTTSDASGSGLSVLGIYVDGVLQCEPDTLIVNSSGISCSTPGTLTPGAHKVVAVWRSSDPICTVKGGCTSGLTFEPRTYYSNPVTITAATVANQPPSVTLTSPTNTDAYTPPANITLTATASDSDGTIGTVRFFNGANLIGSGTRIPNTNTYTYSWSAVAAGSYDVYAQATDNGNATSSSSHVSVLNYNPPSVAITSPTNNSVAGPGTTFSLTANASPSSPDVPIAKVVYYLNGSYFGESTSAPYTLSWKPTVDGSYTLTAKAWDSARNFGTSAPVVVRLTTPPTVTLVAPTASVLNLPTHVVFSASASDADGIDYVEFYSGTSLLGRSPSTASPYAFDWVATDGSYDVSAKAYDKLGASTQTATVHIRVNAPPSAVMIFPTDGRVYPYPTATFSVSVNATDADGIKSVEFFDNGTSIGLSTDSATPYHLAWQPSTSISRGHAITAKVTDNLNAVTISAPSTIFVNQVPTATLAQPTAGTHFTTTQAISLLANATDPDAPDDSVTTVTYTIRSGSTIVQTRAVSAPFAYITNQLAADKLPIGGYTVTAVATDSHGGQSTETPAVTFYVDSPAAPTVTLAQPSATAPDGFIFAGDAVILNATVTDVAGTLGQNGVRVDFLQGCPGQAQAVIGASSAAPYTFTTQSLSQPGVYCFFARATSLADATKVYTSLPQQLNLKVNGKASTIVISKPLPPSNLVVNNVKVAPRTVLYADAPTAPLDLQATVTDLEGNTSYVEFYAWVQPDAANNRKVLLATVPATRGQTIFAATVDLKQKLPFLGAAGTSWPVMIGAQAFDTRNFVRDTYEWATPQGDGIDECGAGTALTACANRRVPIAYIASANAATACGGSGADSCTSTVPSLPTTNSQVTIQGERVDRGGQEVAGFLTYTFVGGQSNYENHGLQPIRNGIDAVSVSCPSGISDACYLDNVRDGDRARYSVDLGAAAKVNVKARVWLPAPKALLNPRRVGIEAVRGGDVAVDNQVTGAYLGQPLRPGTTFSLSEMRVSIYAISPTDASRVLVNNPDWTGALPTVPIFSDIIHAARLPASNFPAGPISLIAIVEARVINVTDLPNDEPIRHVEYQITGPESPLAVITLREPQNNEPLTLIEDASRVATNQAVEGAGAGVSFAQSDSPQSTSSDPDCSTAGANNTLISTAEWTAEGTDGTNFIQETGPGHWFRMNFCDYALPANRYQLNFSWRYPQNGLRVDYFTLQAKSATTVPPSVAITSPEVNKHFVSGASAGPTVTVATEIAGTTDPTATVDFYRDSETTPAASVLVANLRAVASFSLPVNSGAAPVMHTVLAKLRLGGSVVAQAPPSGYTFQVYVDPPGSYQAPTVVINSPVNMDAQQSPQYTPGTTVALRATVTTQSQNVGAVSNTRFEVTPAGGSATTITATYSGGLMSASWTPTAGGVYTLRAMAFDGTSDGVSAPISVAIGAASFTLEQPVVHLTSEIATHHPEVGALDGSASSDGGTAGYSIPIALPPGRAGMQPGFSLNYSSRGGNGIAGMGWSLSGLSSIHRCPQSVDQDGQTLPVSYGNTDRLCLDGQRLIRMSGSYGVAGATYRTEIDSFARVTQLGGDLGSTATCFKLELKSGEIQWYGGHGAGCAIERNTRVLMGNGKPLSWLIDKREDRVGNNVLYFYQQAVTGGLTMPGEVLIDHVDYTGFGEAGGTRSVKFSYGTRPNGQFPDVDGHPMIANDWSSSYIGGYVSMQTRRLIGITTFAPAAADGSATSYPVRTYELSYALDAAGTPLLGADAVGRDFSSYSGRSLLRALHDCGYDENGGSKTCHAWTRFDWQEARPTKPFDFHELSLPIATQAKTVTVPLAYDTTAQKWVTAAGYYDAVASGNATSANRAYPQSGLLQRPGPTPTDPTTTSDNPQAVLSGFSVFGDIDGDGTAEVLARVGTLNENGFLNTGHQLVKLNASRQVAGVVDVGAIKVGADGKGFALYASDGATNPLNPIYTDHADLNNDGRTDLVGQLNGHLAFAFFNGSWRDPASTTPVAFAAGNFSFKETTIPVGRSVQVVDMNLDGKPDLLVLRADVLTDTCSARPAGSSTIKTRALVFYPNLSSGGNPDQLVFGASTLVACLDVTTEPPVVGNGQDIQRISDFDGNGLADIWIRRDKLTGSGLVYSTHWVTDELIKTTIAAPATATSPATLAFTRVKVNSFASDCELGENATARSYGFWIDVNGDGLEDLVSAGQSVRDPGSDINSPTCLSTAQNWTIRLNQGGALGAPINTGSQAGFPVLPPGVDPNAQGYTKRQILGPVYPMDVDADGRAELMIPKSFAMQMCTYHHPELGQQCEQPGQAGCGYYYCPEDPVTGKQLGSENLASPDVQMTHLDASGNAVGDNYDTEVQGMFKKGKSTFNPSVYNMAAVRFVQTGPTAFSLVESASGGVTASSNISAGSSAQDAFGDGLVDIVQPVGCPFATRANADIPMCSTPWLGGNAPTLPDGSSIYQFVSPPVSYRTDPLVKTYLGENMGAGGRGTGQPPKQPELMNRSVQAVGLLDMTAEWDFYPLASTGGRASSDSLPLYQVPARAPVGSGITTGYVDDNHFYFASSMNVVAAARTSNGLGGMNSTRYGYEEAMYNNRGRGFTGFRAISVDNQVPGVESRTRTVFHQKYPLSGQVESVETRPVVGGIVKGLISRTTFNWRCFITVDSAGPVNADPSSGDAPCPSLANPPIVPARNVSWFTYLDSSSASSYDLTSAEQGSDVETSHVDKVDRAYNDQGNGAPGYDRYGNATASYSVTADRGDVYLQAQTQISTTTYKPVDSAHLEQWWLNETDTQTSTGKVVWSAAHTPPAGVDTSDKSTSTKYAFSQDGKRQLLHTVAQQGLVGEEISSDRTYTLHGLPDVVTTTADSFSTNPVEKSRFVDIDYSSDGYFAAVTRNTLGHSARSSVRPRDGQVQAAVDAVGNSTTVVHDLFGQPVQEDHYDVLSAALVPTAFTRRDRCAGCDGFANAVIKVVHLQDGAPVQYSYLDRLARTIAVRSAIGDGGSDSTFTIVETAFDAAGRTLWTSQPHAAGQPMYATTMLYDRAGRVVKKTDQPGGGIANRTTLYKYSGRTTQARMQPESFAQNINAPCPQTTDAQGSVVCFDIYRQTDSLGRFVTATDQAGKVSRYWFDGGGHPAAIQGVDLNITKASYNASGQRLSVSDPDSGSWTFQYDAAGELLKQTDARGVVTQNQYDRLGRMRQSDATAVNLGDDFGAQAITDTWTYDTRGAGLLSTVKRNLSAQGEIWKQDVYYTPQSRVDHVATRMDCGNDPSACPGGQQWTETTNYHSYYGWPRSHVFPSGLEVHQRYTRYGTPLAITDGVTTWQQAIAWDGMGNVTTAKLGNGLTETSTYAQGSGQMLTRAVAPGVSPAVDTWTYGYNDLGSIKSQRRQAPAAGSVAAIDVTENYLYDARQRLMRASVGAATVNYGYLDNGNIDYKSDYSTANNGAYAYGNGITGSDHAGPHAVKSIQLAGGGSVGFQYDNNGNVIGGDIVASYDADNLPWQVRRVSTGGLDRFAYGTGNQRYRHRESTDTRETYYSESGYERTRVGAGQFEYRHHLGGVLIKVDAAGVRTATYLHTDRLGSTVALSDSAGAITDRRSYDAFGQARDGNFLYRDNGKLKLLPKQNRGFTDHEHLDDTLLIHMNGRVYDYRVGRFMGADPLIQFPQNSQSLNAYSYIMNNPLAGTDPTGYAAEMDCTGPRWACNQQANGDAQRTMSLIGKSEINHETGEVIITPQTAAANASFLHGAAGQTMAGFSSNFFNGGQDDGLTRLKSMKGLQALSDVMSEQGKGNQAEQGTASDVSYGTNPFALHNRLNMNGADGDNNGMTPRELMKQRGLEEATQLKVKILGIEIFNEGTRQFKPEELSKSELGPIAVQINDGFEGKAKISIPGLPDREFKFDAKKYSELAQAYEDLHHVKLFGAMDARFSYDKQANIYVNMKASSDNIPYIGKLLSKISSNVTFTDDLKINPPAFIYQHSQTMQNFMLRAQFGIMGQVDCAIQNCMYKGPEQ